MAEIQVQRDEISRYFHERSDSLQKEIDTEIEKQGGLDMLISRPELMAWIYSSRSKVKCLHAIADMLKEDHFADNLMAEDAAEELKLTLMHDQKIVDRILEEQKSQNRALTLLQTEISNYQKALELLSSR